MSVVPPPEVVSAPAQAGAPAVGDAVRKPEDLPPAVSAAWDRLAPEAVAAGTLTPSGARDFEVYCWLDVELSRAQRELANAAVGTDGWKALVKGVATLTQRHEIKAKNFILAPVGRPIVKRDADRPKSAAERIRERRQNLHAV